VSESRTELEQARAGEVTPRLRRAAEREGLDPEKLRAEMAAGRAVMPASPAHGNLEPVLIGRAAPVKINANLGLSSTSGSAAGETEKLRLALELGADAVMDLSPGGDLGRIRRLFIETSTAPVGAVPI